MTFHNIRLPTLDEYGSNAGPGNRTAILTMDSGQERRIVRWSQFQHVYDISAQVKKHDLLSAVVAFFYSRGGLANSFRYKDWQDYTSTATGKNWTGHNNPPTPTDVQIGVGDGTTTQFQLVKRYQDAQGSYVRKIKLPVVGTTRVSIDNIEELSGWTVSDTTGLVTFSAAPALGEVVKAGFEFDVPVRFGEGVDEFFAVAVDSYGSGSIPSLPLVEEMDPSAYNEDLQHGGARSIQYGASISIDTSCVLWCLIPTAIELDVVLPALSGVAKGGPIFVLHNLSGSISAFVVSSSLADVVTIDPGAKVELWHGVDGSGVSQWVPLVFDP